MMWWSLTKSRNILSSTCTRANQHGLDFSICDPLCESESQVAQCIIKLWTVFFPLVASLTFGTLTFRQYSYENNSFVVILMSNLDPFARNGSLKYNFSFFTKNCVMPNFKWK